MAACCVWGQKAKARADELGELEHKLEGALIRYPAAPRSAEGACA